MCNFNGGVRRVTLHDIHEKRAAIGRPFLFCDMATRKFSYSRILSPGLTDFDNVVTVAELKSFLRVEHTADDTLLDAMRMAAIGYVEEYTNQFIGTYAVTGYVNTWATVPIPVGPVNAVNSVEYLATNGGSFQTLSTSNWYADTVSQPARIKFVEPPTLADDEWNRIKINATVGIDDDSVPDVMVHAIKMLVANMYEIRTPEVVGTISSQTQFGVRALLSSHRIVFAQ